MPVEDINIFNSIYNIAKNNQDKLGDLKAKAYLDVHNKQFDIEPYFENEPSDDIECDAVISLPSIPKLNEDGVVVDKVAAWTCFAYRVVMNIRQVQEEKMRNE